LRLGRLPALSASKTSESVLTSSISLFVPLLTCLTLGRLPLADCVTWLGVIRRACACGASRRSAAAEIDKPAEASSSSFSLAFFLALVSALACFAAFFYCCFCTIASVLSCWVTNFCCFSFSFCLCLSSYTRFLSSARWRFLTSCCSFFSFLLIFAYCLRACSACSWAFILAFLSLARWIFVGLKTTGALYFISSRLRR
jgi:hypothetical protein